MSTKDFQRWNWDRLWRETAPGDPGEIVRSRYARRAYRCIGGFLDPRTDATILETSCGTGRFCCLAARDLPGSLVVGSDISMSALDIARRVRSHLGVDNVSYQASDMFDLPFADGCFDAVLNEGGIEHFPLSGSPSYEDAIREMVRVTRPGGKVVVAVPNFYCLPHTVHKATLAMVGKRFRYGYEKSFRHDELRAVLESSGLVDVEIRGYFPAHAFYRLRSLRPLAVALGKLVDISSNRWTDDLAGFMIVARGIRPR